MIRARKIKILLLSLLSVSYAYIHAQIIKSEFIFEQAPFQSCHASTVAELPNGDLMAAWFGGTAEGNADVAIWSSVKSKGQWSAPVELARESNVPCWNPVLFYTKDKVLWFYYKYGTHPTSWSAARRHSNDHGASWSATEYLPAGLYGPIRAKPLVCADGTLVSGTSVESYHQWAVWIERSKDNGKSFIKIGPITVPFKVIRTEPADRSSNNAFDWNQTHGIIQPSIVSLDKKHLRLYARSTAETGKIVIADSYDQGMSWTQGRAINVLNPNSGIDALTLQDGRIALVYNNTAEGRSPLNVAISKDGEHFTMLYTLEDTPGEEFSYPSMIQTKDGLIHITYTWKRKCIKHMVIKF
jgi:predicted neuraminidase